jgi:hypothetical protein
MFKLARRLCDLPHGRLVPVSSCQYAYNSTYICIYIDEIVVRLTLFNMFGTRPSMYGHALESIEAPFDWCQDSLPNLVSSTVKVLKILRKYLQNNVKPNDYTCSLQTRHDAAPTAADFVRKESSSSLCGRLKCLCMYQELRRPCLIDSCCLSLRFAAIPRGNRGIAD